MAIILCLLMAILTSCQSEHERQVQMLNDLLEATDNYEVMPNDSDARAVLFYMERHGSPRELQQAWHMMAKMYRRHGALMYEGFAYEMPTRQPRSGRLSAARLTVSIPSYSLPSSSSTLSTSPTRP